MTATISKSDGQQLKSVRFRQEREADWSKLESLVDTYEKRGVEGLSDDEILAAPILYRSTLSALSVARSTSLDRGVIDYLDSLCARGYFFIYGSRSTLWDKVKSFFAGDWPRAVRGVWPETLAAIVLMTLGVVAALVLYSQSVDWFFTFVPIELAGGRDPAASAEALRKTLYSDVNDHERLSFFATYLFTHNVSVALLAFAVGFAFGLPTALVLAHNGALLGMMLGLFYASGLGYEFTGWLTIHGVTELFAICLAGAAGLHVGRKLAFPGEQSRLEAIAVAGKDSGIVMVGVMVMLFVAGLLEGFGRQMISSDILRYGIGISIGVIWVIYFYAPRRQPRVGR
jgi:uncharacterized membrane protein SpoIIM required for sporulation